MDYARRMRVSLTFFWLITAALVGCSAPQPSARSERERPQRTDTRADAAVASAAEPRDTTAPDKIADDAQPSQNAADDSATTATAADPPANAAADDKAPQDQDSGDTTLRPLDPSAPVAMPLDQFLGKRRARIERLLGSHSGTDIGDGWTRYGQSFALRYEGTCAVELVVAMPAGTTCTGPLSGIGFGKRGAPLRRRRACLWPAKSIRHSLGKGLAGSLEFATGRFHAQLVGKARRCRRR